MRRALAYVLVALCLTPLWAEDVDNGPFEVGVEYDREIITGYFYDQIFRFEIEYEPSTSLTKRIRFSWPIPENWHSPWRFMLEVQPPMWESFEARSLHHDPIQFTEFYAGAQYFDETLDARLLYPVAKTIDGHELKPVFLELKRLRLLKIDHRTEFIARGHFSQDETDLDIGVARRLGSLEAKIYSDLEWSIGFRTDINALLR